MCKRKLKHQSGASIIEFLVIVLAMGPLVLGAIQLALFYHAKTMINYATYEAARTGAVRGGDWQKMRQAFVRNVLPFYGGGKSTRDLNSAHFRASWDIRRTLLFGGAGFKIDILSPTRQAFSDFAFRTSTREALKIPNDHLSYRHRQVGQNSKVNIQDANLLKIKVTYGFKMIVPVINKLVANTLKYTNRKNFAYYNADPPRIPIVSYATVRMQSESVMSSRNVQLGNRAP